MNLSSKLAVIMKKMGYAFTLKGRPLSYEELFSENGLLPGLSKRADQLLSLCFGYGMGANYEDKEDSLLGVNVFFDDFVPDVLRIFAIVDVLCEIVKMSPDPHRVSLDELMYD